MDTERLLERLASIDRDTPSERAPARLKSKIYSTLMQRLSESGPLLDLRRTKSDAAGLCAFEASLLPFGERISSMNPCRICHARVLAERLEEAPIFWPHCPYAEFHRGKA